MDLGDELGTSWGRRGEVFRDAEVETPNACKREGCEGSSGRQVEFQRSAGLK